VGVFGFQGGACPPCPQPAPPAPPAHRELAAPAWRRGTAARGGAPFCRPRPRPPNADVAPFPPQKNGRPRPPASGTSTPTASRCVLWRAWGRRKRGEGGGARTRAPRPFFSGPRALRPSRPAPPRPPSTPRPVGCRHKAQVSGRGHGRRGGGGEEGRGGVAPISRSGGAGGTPTPAEKNTHQNHRPPCPPSCQVIVEKAEKSDIPDIDKKK